MKRAISAAVAALLLLVAAPVGAAKPQPGLRLISEVISQTGDYGMGGNLACWDEDDKHVRAWTGALAPGQSFSATERFCEPSLDVNGAGGTGLFVYAGVRGDLTGFITQPVLQWGDTGGNWPDPPYPFPDIPMLVTNSDQTTWEAACVVPYYFLNPLGWYMSTDPIEGGTYTITVRNDTARLLRNITLNIEVRMAWPGHQESCPPEYRNL